MIEAVYKIETRDINFNNMPNDNEYYFTIDNVGNLRVHKCSFIKNNVDDIKYVIIDKTQLTEEQLKNITNL